MPLFDIKVIPGYYFVAGGGGKKDYGISNGIYAINIETILIINVIITP